MDSWPGGSGCVIAGRGWAARLIQALLGQLNPKRRWGGGVACLGTRKVNWKWLSAGSALKKYLSSKAKRGVFKAATGPACWFKMPPKFHLQMANQYASKRFDLHPQKFCVIKERK